MTKGEHITLAGPAYKASDGTVHAGPRSRFAFGLGFTEGELMLTHSAMLDGETRLHLDASPEEIAAVVGRAIQCGGEGQRVRFLRALAEFVSDPRSHDALAAAGSE